MPDDVGESGELQIESSRNFDDINTLLGEGDDKPAEVVEPKPKAPPVPKQEVEVIPDIEDDDATPESRKAKGAAEEEEEEEEDFLNEEDAEAEELRSAGEPPLLRPLKEKHPELFKGPEGKQLRTALFREHKFSQLFLDPVDAEEQVQTIQDQKELEHEILRGDTSKVLKAIQKTDEGGYRHFVSNFLPTLYEYDRKTYTDVISPVLASVLSRAKAVGEGGGNKNLALSAKHIANLIWPEHRGEIPNLEEKQRAADPELERRRQELEYRERELDQRNQRTFIQSTRAASESNLRKRIEKGLDSEGVLNKFLKDSVVEKTMAEVQAIMNEDEGFGRTMKNIFEKAGRSGYSNEFRMRMIGTYLARATRLIGPVRSRLFNQALGKVGAGDEGKEKGRPNIKRSIPSGSPGGKKVVKSSEIDWAHTTDLEILSGKATLRKR